MPAATFVQEHLAAEEQSAFLSKREVLRLIPISAPTLWDWVRKEKFPVPRIIGSKTVWLASEVYEWMRTRPARHYKGA